MESGAGWEFRNPDLLIMVMATRFELALPKKVSYLDEATQVSRSAAELIQHMER